MPYSMIMVQQITVCPLSGILCSYKMVITDGNMGTAYDRMLNRPRDTIEHTQWLKLCKNVSVLSQMVWPLQQSTFQVPSWREGSSQLDGKAGLMQCFKFPANFKHL